MTTAMIYQVKGRETITSLASAVGFTAAQIPPTKTSTMYAVAQAIDGDARFTIDGTTPTSSLGLRLLQDSSVEIWGSTALAAFRAIDDGGTAKLDVVYMGAGS